MDKHVFYFQDEKLNADKASGGTLKIIVGSDGISLLALSATREVLGLEAIEVSDKIIDNQFFESEFVEYLRSQKLLSLPFGTVRAVLSTSLATLVPQRLFSPSEYAKYFQLLMPTAADTLFGHQEIPAFGCQLVWGAPPSFQYFIREYQPGHLATALIQKYHTLASAEGFSIFLNIRGHRAQITVFDLRGLVFYNTFEFNKPTDLLYFVLLVYDQFRLNPEHVPLQLSGGLLETGDHYKMLYRYIRNIQFLAPNAGLSLPKSDQALPDHYWFDLLSL